MSVGSLLAEILSRQQAKLPSSEQQGLDRATLDAMTREASGELANTWEKLSTDLSSVERNVSQVLRQQLDEAESTTIARLTRLPASMRSTISPAVCKPTDLFDCDTRLVYLMDTATAADISEGTPSFSHQALGTAG